MEYSIPLIVSIIGAFGSIITIYLNRINQTRAELRSIKEKQYIDFLSSLAMARIAKDEEKYKINMELSSRIQNIYLVGNKLVQKALEEFLECLKQSTPNKSQDKLYANLILQMKLDLYEIKIFKVFHIRKDKVSLEKIEFTVFMDK